MVGYTRHLAVKLKVCIRRVKVAETDRCIIAASAVNKLQLWCVVVCVDAVQWLCETQQARKKTRLPNVALFVFHCCWLQAR